MAEAERKIAELENAESALWTSAGSAATFCVFATLCEAGDEVIACDSVYGGTIKILTKSSQPARSQFTGLSPWKNQPPPEIAGERTRVFWV